jgi:hypothetical protein
MRTIFKFRFFVMLSIILLVPAITQAQADKKEIELKKLEAGVNTAKAKVALNERKLAVADSLITAGTKLIAESKSETKAIDAEAKKVDKEFATQQKPLTKQSSSKVPEEAKQARADLKALNTQYKADTKALTTRLTAATKKGTTGNADIAKGKAAKSNVKDALKLSKEALDVAQQKYDAVANPAPPKGSKKK